MTQSEHLFQKTFLSDVRPIICSYEKFVVLEITMQSGFIVKHNFNVFCMPNCTPG